MNGGRRSIYLVGPVYDWLFFLLPPTASLAIGIAISGTRFTEQTFSLFGQELTGAKLLVGTIIHAHLVAALVRSHGNASIRRLHTIRFLLVPFVLFAALRASRWIAVSSTIVATWWDVWHSGAQTFGFARIYDRNAGNPHHAGRRLDFWLNQLLYAGPILGGVSLLDHLEHLEDFHDVGVDLFCNVPAYVDRWQRYATWGLLGGGTLFLVAYVAVYARLQRGGYRVAWPKVFLLVSTGACSIYTWGLNSWGEAFFIMNLFHGVQYLALVWATEASHLERRLPAVRGRRAILLAVFLAGVLAYGVAAELADADMRSLWSVTMTVSLLHFWYDGFIWSVSRNQI